MKTIKLLSGKIDRISDDKAEYIVRSGKGIYIDKSTWKKQIRDIVH